MYVCQIEFKRKLLETQMHLTVPAISAAAEVQFASLFESLMMNLHDWMQESDDDEPDAKILPLVGLVSGKAPHELSTQERRKLLGVIRQAFTPPNPPGFNSMNFWKESEFALGAVAALNAHINGPTLQKIELFSPISILSIVQRFCMKIFSNNFPIFYIFI